MRQDSSKQHLTDEQRVTQARVIAYRDSIITTRRAFTAAQKSAWESEHLLSLGNAVGAEKEALGALLLEPSGSKHAKSVMSEFIDRVSYQQQAQKEAEQQGEFEI